MSKVTLGILAFVALAACCLVPLGTTDAQITTDDGDVIKVSGTASFDISYTTDSDKDLTYSAKVIDKSGNTQSSAVSPSTGSLNSGEAKTLTVTAPSSAGTYKLVVEYLLDDEKASSEEYSFKAVNPIVLKVNLKADDITLNLEEFGVYFYIDGKKMEDSFKTVSLASDGTGSVSYDWIADPETSKHTFKVVPVGGSQVITGLNEEHTFYTSDNDYSLLIVLAFVILVILVVFVVRVYRKPVKNYGKPKSRR